MKPTAEEFADLLDSYGADPSRWPPLLRANADQIQDDPQLQVLWQQARDVDALLDGYTLPAFAGLEQRLLQQMRDVPPRRGLDRLLDWLLPEASALSSVWFRPVMLACLPLLLGLVMGLQFEPAGSLSFEEELYFISLSDFAEVL